MQIHISICNGVKNFNGLVVIISSTIFLIWFYLEKTTKIFIRPINGLLWKVFKKSVILVWGGSFTMKCSIFVCVCLVIIPSGKTELGKENVTSDRPWRRQKIISLNYSFTSKSIPRALWWPLEGREAVWQKKQAHAWQGLQSTLNLCA